MEDNEANNTNTNTNTNQIPSDLEVEIFARLPLKSLMRFESVCKHWKALITLHLAQYSNTKPSSRRILISFKGKGERYMYSTSLDGGPATHHLTLPASEDCWVSESLNGLVCYYNDLDFYICNPSMRKVKTLPRTTSKNSRTRSRTNSYSFGFNPCTKEYKILHLVRNEWHGRISCQIFTLRTDSRTGEVFTLETDSWKDIILTGTIPVLPYPFRTGGMCVNGVIHWLACFEKRLVLVAFDLGCEEFRFITLPEGLSSSYSSVLTKVRGCLTLLDYGSSIEMWVLRDYENQLWIHEISIESPYYYWFVRNPISLGDEYIGEMLLAPDVFSHECIMFPYHLKTKSMRTIRVSGLPDWIMQHSEKDMEFRISNHVENLSPLTTKRPMQFGGFTVYVNV